MRIAAIIILTGIFGIFAFEVYTFLGKNGGLSEQYETVRAKLFAAKEESEKLKSDFAYFLQPGNLEKEFRARFNYKKNGEKMMIIVPRNE